MLRRPFAGPASRRHSTRAVPHAYARCRCGASAPVRPYSMVRRRRLSGRLRRAGRIEKTSQENQFSQSMPSETGTDTAHARAAGRTHCVFVPLRVFHFRKFLLNFLLADSFRCQYARWDASCASYTGQNLTLILTSNDRVTVRWQRLATRAYALMRIRRCNIGVLACVCRHAG